MKQILFLLGIILITFGCSDNKAKTENNNAESANTKETPSGNEVASNKPKQIFAIKAAKIVYNIPSGPETGTETFYFDDYGAIAVMVMDKKSKFGKNR